MICNIFYIINTITGEVTSGCPSPSMGKDIAIVYVSLVLPKIGTPLELKHGKKLIDCEATKMSFYPTITHNEIAAVGIFQVIELMYQLLHHTFNVICVTGEQIRI